MFGKMKKTLLTGIAALFNNYTRIILTVIAITLVMHVWQQRTIRDELSWLSSIENHIGAIGDTLDGIERRMP
jgi:hypothetical protein